MKRIGDEGAGRVLETRSKSSDRGTKTGIDHEDDREGPRWSLISGFVSDLLKKELNKELDFKEDADNALREAKHSLAIEAADALFRETTGLQMGPGIDGTQAAKDLADKNVERLRGEIFGQLRYISALGVIRSETSTLVNQIEHFGYYGVK